MGGGYDNALAVTIHEQVERATLDWGHGYNCKRLLESIGYIPPAEAEAVYYRQQASQAKAA